MPKKICLFVNKIGISSYNLFHLSSKNSIFENHFFFFSDKIPNKMKTDKDCSLKFLLDMCKISYTETQLIKLKRYLSILYVVRKCSVRLEKTLTIPKIKTIVIPNIVTKTGSKQKQLEFCPEYLEHEDISNSEDENWMPEHSVQLSDSEYESSLEMSDSKHYKNSPKKQKLDTETSNLSQPSNSQKNTFRPKDLENCSPKKNIDFILAKLDTESSNLSLPKNSQENLYQNLIKHAKETEPGVINVSFSNQNARPYDDNTELNTSHELDAESMPKKPVPGVVKLSFPSVGIKAVKKHLSNEQVFIEKRTIEKKLQQETLELDSEKIPKKSVSGIVKLSFPSVSSKAVKKHLSNEQDFNEKKSVEQKLQEKYKYKCDKCCIYYDCAQKLDMHMITVHEKEKSRCQYCDKTFATSEALKKHIISHNRAAITWAHEREKSRCQNCDKTFATSEAFKKHIISHYKVYESVFPFMCEKCCKSFGSRDELNKHFRIAHEKEENERQALLCDKCFECFESEELLNLHIKASHQKGSVSTYKIYKDTFFIGFIFNFVTIYIYTKNWYSLHSINEMLNLAFHRFHYFDTLASRIINPVRLFFLRIFSLL